MIPSSDAGFLRFWGKAQPLSRVPRASGDDPYNAALLRLLRAQQGGI